MFNIFVTVTSQFGSCTSGFMCPDPISLDDAKQARDAIQKALGGGKLNYLTLFNPPTFVDGHQEVEVSEILLCEELLRSSFVKFSIVESL
jgi:hypothetical protein